jgi:uncharacterized repeat protein (TIGR01451 family)
MIRSPSRHPGRGSFRAVNGAPAGRQTSDTPGFTDDGQQTYPRRHGTAVAHTWLVRCRIPSAYRTDAVPVREVMVFARRAAWLLLIGTGLSLMAAPGLKAQTPVYQATRADDVTGVKARTTTPQCNNCIIPDPNPPAGTRKVDSYNDDRYERPVVSAGGGTYLPELDIVSTHVGFDSTWFYYRINLFGAGTSSLGKGYAFELNVDPDDRPDLLVIVAGADLTASFSSNKVAAWWDTNNSVGGATLLGPDGPGGHGNGYETDVFRDGVNKLIGTPGGSDAVRVRKIVGEAAFELAIRRTFLNALAGSAVTKIAFRGWAGEGSFDQALHLYHDSRSRSQAGSPYPYLQLSGAPASCPSVTDNTITAAQRAALESGTGVQTAFLNPCWPNGNVYLVDNSGGIGDLEWTLEAVRTDMSISKSASPASALIGNSIVYTVLASNLGPAQATFVSVIDSLPAGVTFQSVTATQGSCSVSGLVVSCSVGTVNSGASVTIAIQVLAPSTSGSITNIARVSAAQNDPTPANNRTTLVTSVTTVPALTVVKAVSPTGATVPGAVLAYSITFLNGGGGGAVDVIVTDDLPSAVAFKLNSTQSTLPSGVTAVVEYYNGVGWTYGPVSGGCGAPAGYDACVLKLRWRLGSPLPASAQGQVSFEARVK